MTLYTEIHDFLEKAGICCREACICEVPVLICRTSCSGEAVVIPVPAEASDIEEARRVSDRISDVIRHERGNGYPLVITEDRWRCMPRLTRLRLTAHLEIFDHIYARNCEVRRIDKTTAADFLSQCHSYGDAACRYRYGLFLKRHTGHIASEGNEPAIYQPGTLVAAATFSNARRWEKSGRIIRSYEWTRYASLPGVRVTGGMGRLLKAFIADVAPDDIMTYADLEWSEGKVYESLGFVLEGKKEEVTFAIDRTTWRRRALRAQDRTMGRAPEEAGTAEDAYFVNFGSNKYRLKLTDYQ